MPNVPFNSKTSPAELLRKAKESKLGHINEMSFEELPMIKEAESLRLKGPKRFWTIEQYKFWKGLDKTCWSPHMGRFVSDDYDRMNDLMAEIERVDKGAILRIVPQKKLEAETIEEIEKAEGRGRIEPKIHRIGIDLAGEREFYYVTFQIEYPSTPMILSVEHRGRFLVTDPHKEPAVATIRAILAEQIRMGMWI